MSAETAPKPGGGYEKILAEDLQGMMSGSFNVVDPSVRLDIFSRFDVELPPSRTCHSVMS